MNLGFLNKRGGLLGEENISCPPPLASQHFVREPEKMAVLEHINLGVTYFQAALNLEDLTGLLSLDSFFADE